MLSYAKDIINIKSRKLIGNYGFMSSDLEDLQQELMLDLLKRLPRFDPNKAQINTFIDRVVKHKIHSIIEKRMAKMRDYRLSYSFDESNNEFYSDNSTVSEYELIELKIDVNKTIDSLPEHLKWLCNQLKVKRQIEIAREIHRSHATINHHLKKIRRVFHELDLIEYL